MDLQKKYYFENHRLGDFGLPIAFLFHLQFDLQDYQSLFDLD